MKALREWVTGLLEVPSSVPRGSGFWVLGRALEPTSWERRELKREPLTRTSSELARRVFLDLGGLLSGMCLSPWICHRLT